MTAETILDPRVSLAVRQAFADAAGVQVQYVTIKSVKDLRTGAVTSVRLLHLLLADQPFPFGRHLRVAQSAVSVQLEIDLAQGSGLAPSGEIIARTQTIMGNGTLASSSLINITQALSAVAGLPFDDISLYVDTSSVAVMTRENGQLRGTPSNDSEGRLAAGRIGGIVAACVALVLGAAFLAYKHFTAQKVSATGDKRKQPEETFTVRNPVAESPASTSLSGPERSRLAPTTY